MPWSKGAVVIIKHGDPDMADRIEQVLTTRKMSDDERRELEELRMHKHMTSIHDDRFTDSMIKAIERDHGPIAKPMPKWLDILLGPFALIVYGVSLFADKYLVIK